MEGKELSKIWETIKLSCPLFPLVLGSDDIATTANSINLRALMATTGDVTDDEDIFE